MTRTSQFTTWGLLATLAATTAAPVLADSHNDQKNKNQWRTLGVAGAVIAGYGLLTGNKTATVLGAAGGAFSANRYEQDRHSQSQDNSNDGRRYHRTYGWQPPVVNNNRYNNRDSNGYGSNNGYGNNGQYNNGQYNDGNGYGNAWAKKQKHHGQGWYKNHSDQDGDRDNGDRG